MAMLKLNVYLNFDGNCREAMTYYQECLGGDLDFQTVGGSPLEGSMPNENKESILHSSLTTPGFVIMGSDMGCGGLLAGTRMSMCLDCVSEEQIRTLYDGLSAGGNVKHPIEHSFWGALYGDLTDRYGNQWILNYTIPVLQD
jgi:PhnB protein